MPAVIEVPRREKKLAIEQAKLKRDFKERAISVKKSVEAKKGKHPCQPCKNRRRACDFERPVCGTCIRLKIGAKCVYKTGSSLDQVSFIRVYVQFDVAETSLGHRDLTLSKS